MLNKACALFTTLCLLFIVGCATHTHNVGDVPVPVQNVEVVKRQWYAAWGLVPINDVDTNAIAAGATDYQIVTSYTATDWVVSIALGWASINTRTVVVKIPQDTSVPILQPLRE